MKWGLWSTTAGSNSSTPPDGWPEGQLPSTVNDCAREMMASIRTGINDIGKGFIDLGMSPTFVSTTKFTVAGDATPYLPVGTRLRASDASTLYGSVISASFSTNSAFTVTLDTGVFTSSLTSIAVGVIKNNDGNGNLPDPLTIRNMHADGTVSISATSSTPFYIKSNTTFAGFWLNCSGGAKLVGVSSASNMQWINSANTIAIMTLTDAGALTAAGDITAFSDERLKSDWKDLPRDFIERLANIKRSGTFTKDGERHAGVGAQSFLEILPEAVNQSGEYMSMAYGNAALVACVELARKVVSLEDRLAKLENTR
jgi:hypothetical protein